MTRVLALGVRGWSRSAQYARIVGFLLSALYWHPHPAIIVSALHKTRFFGCLIIFGRSDEPTKGD